MRLEADAQYYARREEQELLLAVSAPSELERRAHFALANAYRVKLMVLKKAGGAPVAAAGADRPVEDEWFRDL